MTVSSKRLLRLSLERLLRSAKETTETVFKGQSWLIMMIDDDADDDTDEDGDADD